MQSRIKVLWICHFSDPSIQKFIKPWKQVTQFAPWISNTIPIFENRPDIELHIISPHEYIYGIREYVDQGVHYHFFNPYIPVWGRHWPGLFKWDVWTDYAKNKRIVRKIVDKIKPDVIHLQGAENPYYSATVIPLLGKLPIVVNLQRINLEFLKQDNLRAKIERTILNNATFFTIRTTTMERDIKAYRSDAKVLWASNARPTLVPISVNKEFDLVYFARVSKEKGIEDLIKAMGLVHSKLPHIKLCIIGGASDRYKEYLHEMAKALQIDNDIIWKGYLPSLVKVHNEASKAKVSVLPTYNDIIPGTIIESMQLGLPVVSYKAGSIPELNEEEENVLLSEIGDIEGLANNITRLLSDEELYNTMSKRGIECIKERFSNQNVFQQHMDCYKEVIADFHGENHELLTNISTEQH